MFAVDLPLDFQAPTHIRSQVPSVHHGRNVTRNFEEQTAWNAVFPFQYM